MNNLTDWNISSVIIFSSYVDVNLELAINVPEANSSRQAKIIQDKHEMIFCNKAQELLTLNMNCHSSLDKFGAHLHT